MSTFTETTDRALEAERVDFEAAIALRDDRIAELEAQLTPSTPQTLIGTSRPWDAGSASGSEQAVRYFIDGGARPGSLDLGLFPDDAMLILSRRERGPWFWDLCEKIRAARSGELIPVLAIHEPEDEIRSDSNPMTLDTYHSLVSEDMVQCVNRDFQGAQVLMGASGKDGWWEDLHFPEADQLWFDVYMPGAGRIPKVYSPPEEWLARYVQIHNEINKPMGLAEFACRPMLGEPEDERNYLAWIRQNREWLLSTNHFVAACWYNRHEAPAAFWRNPARARAWFGLD